MEIVQLRRRTRLHSSWKGPVSQLEKPHNPNSPLHKMDNRMALKTECDNPHKKLALLVSSAGGQQSLWRGKRAALAFIHTCRSSPPLTPATCSLPRATHSPECRSSGLRRDMEQTLGGDLMAVSHVSVWLWVGGYLWLHRCILILSPSACQFLTASHHPNLRRHLQASGSSALGTGEHLYPGI